MNSVNRKEKHSIYIIDPKEMREKGRAFAKINAPDTEYMLYRVEHEDGDVQFVVADRKNPRKVIAQADLVQRNGRHEVDNVDTRKEYQGRGLQTFLMDAVKQEAEFKGARKIMAISTKAGIPLYKKTGFKPQNFSPSTRHYELDIDPKKIPEFPKVKAAQARKNH